MKGCILILFSLLPVVALAKRVEAQTGPTPPSLDLVDSLTAQGRIMAARDVLEEWLELRSASASRLDVQRSIWLRGRLTVDPSMAEADFRSLVLEYPGGPYSDDALWRLGLSAAARGDFPEAADRFSDLCRDYPSSPDVPGAEAWLAEHGTNTGSPAGPLPAAGNAAGNGARSGSPGAANSAPPNREPPPGVSPEGSAGSFSVQLGAFRNLELARGLASELSALGYEVRLVQTPGDDLSRVRIGRFPLRNEAEARARDLREKGFEATIVSDAGNEKEIGLRQRPAPAPSGF